MINKECERAGELRVLDLELASLEQQVLIGCDNVGVAYSAEKQYSDDIGTVYSPISLARCTL